MAAQLQELLGLGPVEAQNLLDAAGGRVDAAMNLYFEMQAGSPGQPGGHRLGGTSAAAPAAAAPPAAPPPALPPGGAPVEPAPPAPVAAHADPAPEGGAAAPRQPGKRIRIRVRGPSGQATLDGIDDGMPLAELKQRVSGEVGVPADRQRVLIGFPPRPLPDDGAAALSALGVRDGEQLTVQLSDNVGKCVQGHTMGKYVPPSNPKGSFTRRVMPNDNSCMFHSAAYVLEQRSRSIGPELRKRCAEVVAANPKRFTTEFLSRPNPQYCQWILHKDTWGGAIELSILSFLYTTEIMAMDIQTTKLYRYGEGEGYTTRVFVLYTGRHYDAMAMAPYGGCPEGPEDQVMFSSTDESVLDRARSYVQSEYLKLGNKQ